MIYPAALRAFSATVPRWRDFATEWSKNHRKMEGHSANFWNEIADQIQRNDGKEQQKSTKNLPKSVQNRSWKRSWRILGPSSPQESPKSAKNAQNCVRGPPPRIQVGSQNPCKIDPEAFQMQFFFVSFFGSRSNTSVGRFASDPGPKMEQKSSQNRCPKRSCRKCKIFKKH